MTPQRKETVNGHLIEEFYWNGRSVIYIENHKFHGCFDDAISTSKKQPNQPPTTVKPPPPSAPPALKQINF